MNELRDAKRAFGFGLTFLTYAVWLAYLGWSRARRVRDDTRAKLIHDGAQARRSTLLQEEGIDA